jgi:thymidylate synthase ThyX
VIKFLPPLQAEKQAYALARYSRSADPVEASLAWVETHSEEKFWESFYFDYGHASIADLGHVAVCFEGISELAAQEVLDEQVWDGQARSTRYQDFATTGWLTPAELAGDPLEGRYHATVERLITSYEEVHAQALEWLRARHPRPAEMKEGKYERNLAARAFDMARYLLPLAIPTSVGQVVSIRTLERQISRLLVSDLAEVRALGERLVEGCRTAPAEGARPPAPTLARHARPDEFTRGWRAAARGVVAERFAGVEPPATSGVTLVGAASSPVEILTGLLYGAARVPWARLAERVAELEAGERREILENVLAARRPFDELPRAARAGQRYLFEIVMDMGGWRDMHRHRRCQQLVQELDVEAGAELPPDAEAAGIAARCVEEHGRAVATARAIRDACGAPVAAYVLPLAHRVRSVFKMDFAEADYIARLRSGVKGHASYRRIAWLMRQELCRAEPELAGLTDATSPDVEDPLTR